MFKPNKQQARALVEFATRAGHQWKSKLRNHWCADRYMAGKQEEFALLRQVRNEAEPSWLHKVKLEDIKRLANPGLEDNGKAKLDSTFDTTYCGDFQGRRIGNSLEVMCEGHGSILIGPGELGDLVSMLCLAKEQGHVR